MYKRHKLKQEPCSRGNWGNQTWVPRICTITSLRHWWSGLLALQFWAAGKMLWLNELVDVLSKAALKAMCLFYVHDGQDKIMASLGEHFLIRNHTGEDSRQIGLTTRTEMQFVTVGTHLQRTRRVVRRRGWQSQLGWGRAA